MKLAICLYKYFPYGGLQRDFFRIAQLAVERGHQVIVYTLSWEGAEPEWLTVQRIHTDISGLQKLSGVAKYRQFSTVVSQRLREDPVDVVLGFNKMPGLDVYYCADPCFEHKAQHLRPWWYRFGGRYKHFSHYENLIFQPGATTEILMISSVQQRLFQQYYGTEPERMTMLPPGISRDRCMPSNAEDVRARFRHQHDLADDRLLLLQVGSGFRTKGVDRSLLALSALPEPLLSQVVFYIVGQDDPSSYQRQAVKLGVAQQVKFFSGRDDIPDFLLAADLLIHPAYAENTGTVILEALVAGLPVLTTDVCGYASYVSTSEGGYVLPSPFVQQTLNCTLADMLSSVESREQWRNNALTFAGEADIYSMPERVLEKLESVAEGRQ